jgi:hypothetical protein
MDSSFMFMRTYFYLFSSNHLVELVVNTCTCTASYFLKYHINSTNMKLFKRKLCHVFVLKVYSVFTYFPERQCINIYFLRLEISVGNFVLS